MHQSSKSIACVTDGFIRRALVCREGYLTHEETSGVQGRSWIKTEDLLGIADRKLDSVESATTTRSKCERLSRKATAFFYSLLQ